MAPAACGPHLARWTRQPFVCEHPWMRWKLWPSDVGTKYPTPTSQTSQASQGSQPGALIRKQHAVRLWTSVFSLVDRSGTVEGFSKRASRRRFGLCRSGTTPFLGTLRMRGGAERGLDLPGARGTTQVLQYLYTGFKACPTCPAVQFRDWSPCLLLLPRQAAFELGSLVVLVRWFSTGKDAERGTRVVKTG